MKDILFTMFYGSVAMLSLLASIYLLFRRGNAIAPEITPPVRLRRWTAAFFACMTLSHLWYLPTVIITSGDSIDMTFYIGGLLDCMTIFPLAIAVLFVMLQDRRRPLWPIAVMVVPFIVVIVACMFNHKTTFMFQLLQGYFLLMGIGLIIYMVREVRQYGQWLRDNFADLEDKEVWQSYLVLAAILLVFGFYMSGYRGLGYEYCVQVGDIMLTCYLLWRVETLSDLSISQQNLYSIEDDLITIEDIEGNGFSATSSYNIGSLLQEHCIDTQLYLQHDLTLSQLARAIGTNRTYLGQYFSNQGMTYNAYINDLRIDYFISVYREAVAMKHHFTAQKLAHKSGYRSYSTFALAFKQRMGQTVTTWMLDSAK